MIKCIKDSNIDEVAEKDFEIDVKMNHHLLDERYRIEHKMTVPLKEIDKIEIDHSMISIKLKR